MDLSSFEMLNDEFSPLPAGEYEAVVEKIETTSGGESEARAAM